MAQFSICQALLALTCARSHRFYRGDLKRMQAVVFADRHIISNNEAVRAEMIACPCSKTYPAQKPVRSGNWAGMATSCPSVEPKAAPMIGPSRPTEPPLPLNAAASCGRQGPD